MPISVTAAESGGHAISRLGGQRSGSVRSAHRQRGGTQAEGYSADNDIDDDEEGDFEGDDGDEDEDEMAASGDVFGGQDLMNETTIKSGYLWKRGEKRKNWKKRWFALRLSKLCYYKNEKEYQLLRFIDMSDVLTIAAIALKKNQNTFGIVTSKRQYYVRASSQKEMQEWIDALKDAQIQARQNSTLTQDMAAVELATSSGGENVPIATTRPRQNSVSPRLAPADRQAVGKAGNSTSPINIVIPGKGLYSAPAQPRQNSTNTMSPLTATSDSEAGTATAAEQFGLSYTSSAGQSLGSSPSRGVIHHQHEHGHSLVGDEANEGRTATTKRSAGAIREASVGSSGGEGSSGMRTGWTPAGSKAQSQSNQQAALLSSSDEDGEGEDWDEDEIADRAMPLPGSSGFSSTHAGHTQQFLPPASVSTAGGTSKSKVESDFFKEPNKIIHQGYLMKQSNRRKQWRKRWFILTSSHLSYTRSHMDQKAHRQIPLTSILDAIEYTSKKSQPSLQSPPPSSPALQSPTANPPAIMFQLGGAHDNYPASKDGGAEQMSSTPAKEGPPTEKRSNLLLSTSPNPGQLKRKKENCFKVITPKRTYVVGAPTEEEEIKWLSALQALLAHWRGVKNAETETGAVTTNTQTTVSASTASGGTSTAARLARRGSTPDDAAGSQG